MTEIDAGTRLNELLDRVVQQQAAVQTESTPAVETATQEEQPMPGAGATAGDDLATGTAAGDDLAAAPDTDVARRPQADDADFEHPDQWSLERLKHDILSRRANQDETT
jgi:hypothetical protein